MNEITRATPQDVFRMYRVIWGYNLLEKGEVMKAKARNFVTLQDGKIIETTDSSSEVELKNNQIPVTSNELAIIRIVDGDLEYAKNIIRDIEARIRKCASS
jgi:hypothetical protein